MKRQLVSVLMGLAVMACGQSSYATSLWHVYQQALKSDPTFKAAYSQERSVAEKLPQSIAVLLPQINFTGDASYERSRTDSNMSANALSTGSDRNRAFEYNLSLQQSVFNFPYWANLAGAKDTVKAAEATYNAAAQSLMVRVSKAYFAVLNAKDVLRFSRAERDAYYEEYLRAEQSFKVGVKTITDVYNAKAYYDQSRASVVSAENNVANTEEDLRAITAVLYTQLDPLKDKIPLVVPKPANMEKWVVITGRQNWSLISARFTSLSAHKAIASARGGHLPTVDLTAAYDNDYTRTFGEGYTRTKGPSLKVGMALPIFTGGNINSQTRQAIANYDLASNQEEESYRSVTNDARKAYLGIVAGISTVEADRQAIISNRSSLDGMQEGYKVGTRTMVDVLNAQKSLYSAQQAYASARYDYVLSLITLKQSAGTLSDDDLRIINNWLRPYTVSDETTLNIVQQKKTTVPTRAKKMVKHPSQIKAKSRHQNVLPHKMIPKKETKITTKAVKATKPLQTHAYHHHKMMHQKIKAKA